MAWQIEHTDTYSGEANYCWVRRAKIMNGGLTERAIVRRVKAWAGMTGHRCAVQKYGDAIEIRPRGVCQVIFANWQDDEHCDGDEI